MNDADVSASPRGRVLLDPAFFATTKSTGAYLTYLTIAFVLISVVATCYIRVRFCSRGSHAALDDSDDFVCQPSPPTRAVGASEAPQQLRSPGSSARPSDAISANPLFLGAAAHGSVAGAYRPSGAILALQASTHASQASKGMLHAGGNPAGAHSLAARDPISSNRRMSSGPLKLTPRTGLKKRPGWPAAGGIELTEMDDEDEDGDGDGALSDDGRLAAPPSPRSSLDAGKVLTAGGGVGAAAAGGGAHTPSSADYEASAPSVARSSIMALAPSPAATPASSSRNLPGAIAVSPLAAAVQAEGAAAGAVALMSGAVVVNPLAGASAENRALGGRASGNVSGGSSVEETASAPTATGSAPEAGGKAADGGEDSHHAAAWVAYYATQVADAQASGDAEAEATAAALHQQWLDFQQQRQAGTTGGTGDAGTAASIAASAEAVAASAEAGVRGSEDYSAAWAAYYAQQAANDAAAAAAAASVAAAAASLAPPPPPPPPAAGAGGGSYSPSHRTSVAMGLSLGSGALDGGIGALAAAAPPTHALPGFEGAAGLRPLSYDSPDGRSPLAGGTRARW
jgi:hypothetical protein